MGILPVGTGARRYLMSRSALRAECTRLDREANHLACKLVALAGEVDATRAERDIHARAVEAAATRIAELAEQLQLEAAVRGRLQLGNTALQAALANARKVGQLGASLEPSPAELAARARTVADTHEFAVSPEDLVNTTSTAWKADPEPEPPKALARRRPAPRDMAAGLLATRSFTVIPAPHAGTTH